MRARLNYILVFLLLHFFAARAQYHDVYSNYILNMSGINPAAIGKDMALDVNLCARKQWSGFAGSPATNYVSVSSMIKKPAVNLGLIIQSDNIGVSSNQSISGMYAYRFKVKKIRIAFGLKAGLLVSNTNWSRLKRSQEVDALVEQSQNRSVGLVSGTGIYIHGSSFFAGASSPVLYNSAKKVEFNSMMLLMNFGLILKAGKTDIVKPSVMLRRMKGSEIATDLNLTYYFDAKYGIGFSYRLKNAFVVLLEVVVKDQLKLSYCYDYTVSSISKYQNGSHEISLRYLFGKQYNIKNPRALVQ